MAPSDAHRALLGRLVREERRGRHVSVRAAAREAGVDRGTWSEVEEGSRTPQDHTASRMEGWLHWGPGSFDKILAEGGGPLPQAPHRDVAPDPPSGLPDLSGLNQSEREAHIRAALEVLPLIKRYFPDQYDEAYRRWRQLDRMWGSGDGVSSQADSS